MVAAPCSGRATEVDGRQPRDVTEFGVDCQERRLRATSVPVRLAHFCECSTCFSGDVVSRAGIGCCTAVGSARAMLMPSARFGGDRRVVCGGHWEVGILNADLVRLQPEG